MGQVVEQPIFCFQWSWRWIGVVAQVTMFVHSLCCLTFFLFVYGTGCGTTHFLLPVELAPTLRDRLGQRRHFKKPHEELSDLVWSAALQYGHHVCLAPNVPSCDAVIVSSTDLWTESRPD